MFARGARRPRPRREGGRRRSSSLSSSAAARSESIKPAPPPRDRGPGTQWRAGLVGAPCTTRLGLPIVGHDQSRQGLGTLKKKRTSNANPDSRLITIGIGIAKRSRYLVVRPLRLRPERPLAATTSFPGSEAEPELAAQGPTGYAACWLGEAGTGPYAHVPRRPRGSSRRAPPTNSRVSARGVGDARSSHQKESPAARALVGRW